MRSHPRWGLSPICAVCGANRGLTPSTTPGNWRQFREDADGNSIFKQRQTRWNPGPGLAAGRRSERNDSRPLFCSQVDPLLLRDDVLAED
jgi:hypothetical protein